jgi:hypothetical protein
MKKKNAILATIQNAPSGSPGMGDSQPPKNSSAHQRAHQEDGDVFARHEQQVRGRGVFDHEARHEFRFRLGQVEGRAVGFGQRRDEEQHHHRQMRQPVPAKDAPARILRRDDGARFIEPVEMITPMMIRPSDTRS